MVAKYYGKNYSLETLREKTSITREGVSLLGISRAAEELGFRTLGAKIPFERLNELPLPCVVHWKQKHFAVLYDIKIKERKNKGTKGTIGTDGTDEKEQGTRKKTATGSKQQATRRGMKGERMKGTNNQQKVVYFSAN
jgi:ABC-type bacteriocin/lantibiotic exporter with double-glycine peptidase domain